MRTLIVFNHPYDGSYCNAILESVTKGLEKSSHEVDLIHLDKDQFNPRMTSADLKAFVEHSAVDPQVLDYLSFTSVKSVSQQKRVKWLNELENKFSNFH